MIRQILVIISTFSLLSCFTENKINKQSKTTDSIYVDSSVIAILQFDTAHFWEFKNCKSTELSIKDLSKIEIILRKCIKEYNPAHEKQYNEIKLKKPESDINIKNFIIDLARYKRQYIAVINSIGEKEVWINCFCGTSKNWEKEIIVVYDGGNCYFNLKINLTRNQYYDLEVNGDA